MMPTTLLIGQVLIVPTIIPLIPRAATRVSCREARPAVGARAGLVNGGFASRLRPDPNRPIRSSDSSPQRVQLIDGRGKAS
jgi:hypothetical protein